MRKFVRQAALAVLAPAAALGMTLVAPAASASAATATTTLESQVVSLTNEARVKAGCKKLTVNASLAKAARDFSADMAAKNYFSHTGADGSNFTQRAKRAGFAKTAMGENIAWGYKDAQGVVRGWLNSPGHRKNIMNCKSTLIGVGAARNAKGVLYWTQEFGK
ncbi:CAP domain-containing protein [Catenuloplanes atrovinosus]|uniref:Uncharacterized protein YkwD n=1 Tax=Catenuloplanes atrovinosus TaxID=137266 RepID=A0AAE3YJD8_9ACTN|nr:CAP domain-containing protein [Catenuloplanes atrovinosus]MDR7273967.1 uncharacterized protein YkwD [Catenuloplanes atrovinosus]